MARPGVDRVHARVEDSVAPPSGSSPGVMGRTSIMDWATQSTS